MSVNFCRSIKQEYEALKTLTQEFISACEKAGDLRALSSDQLRTLQIQKQKLEMARDTVEEQMKDTTWKKVRDEILSTRIDHGQYSGMSVQEVISQSEQEGDVFAQVEFNAKRAWMHGGDARTAVIDFNAALYFGILNEFESEKLRKRIEDEKCLEVIRNDMTSRQRNDDKTIDTWQFLMELEALEGLTLLEPNERASFLEHAKLKAFQDELGDNIVKDASEGIRLYPNRVNSRCSWRALCAFSAALRFELLTTEQRMEIRKILHARETQVLLCASVYDIVENRRQDELIINAMRILNAMNVLSEHSFRRRRK